MHHITSHHSITVTENYYLLPTAMSKPYIFL